MQDIDFGKFYRKNRPFAVPESRREKQQPPRGNGSASGVTVIFAVAVFCLAVGFFFGTQLQKHRYSQQIEANVGSDEVSTANISPAVKSTQLEESVKVHSVPADKEAKKNVKKSASTKVVTQATKQKDTYLILAKIYPDEKEASLNGLNLKRNGLPVFLARNGKKLKLYVGPIEGRTEAYNVLGRVKNMPDYQGAILYRR